MRAAPSFGALRQVRQLGLALSAACAWVACIDLAALQDGAATDAGADQEAGLANVTTDGGTIDSAAGDVVTDVVDPLDAADAFQLTGPPSPPTCTSNDAGAFECIPLAPVGWVGPFAFYEGNLQDAPSCGAVTQMLAANSSLVQPAAATCPACQCNSATGTSCGDVALTGRDSSCTAGSAASGPTIAVNQCVHLGYGSVVSTCCAAGTLIFGPSAVVGGSCTPTFTKPTPTLAPHGWNVAAVGCNNLAPATPGCSTNQVCAAAPAPPFNAKSCIYKDGDHPACPGAPYSNRKLFYKGVADSRDCNDCSCDPPNAAQCSVTGTTSDSISCSPVDYQGPAGTCVFRDDGANNFYYTRAVATLPTVTCPAKGGSAKGAVAAANPVTVCCAN